MQWLFFVSSIYHNLTGEMSGEIKSNQHITPGKKRALVVCSWMKKKKEKEFSDLGSWTGKLLVDNNTGNSAVVLKRG